MEGSRKNSKEQGLSRLLSAMNNKNISNTYKTCKSVSTKMFNELSKQTPTGQTHPPGLSPGYIPKYDIMSDTNSVIVIIETPGIDPNSLNIEVMGNDLSVQGIIKSSSSIIKDNFKDVLDGKNFLINQIKNGQFDLSIKLPFIIIKKEAIQCTIDNGLILFYIIKTHESKKIKIQCKKT